MEKKPYLFGPLYVKCHTADCWNGWCLE